MVWLAEPTVRVRLIEHVHCLEVVKTDVLWRRFIHNFL